MSPALINIMLASLFGALVSTGCAVLLTFRATDKWLSNIISFSSGLLLATALINILPEALQLGMPTHTLFTLLTISVVALFVFEKTILSFFSHSDHENIATISRPVPIILIGGALHLGMDGLLLAATFLTSPTLGWMMALAIVAHEIPRESGDFAVLLAAGWSKKKTLICNLVVRLACMLGGIIGFSILNMHQAWLDKALVISAASFIYISIACLLPWLRAKNDGWHSVSMSFGVLIGYYIPS